MARRCHMRLSWRMLVKCISFLTLRLSADRKAHVGTPPSPAQPRSGERMQPWRKSWVDDHESNKLRRGERSKTGKTAAETVPPGFVTGHGFIRPADAQSNESGFSP